MNAKRPSPLRHLSDLAQVSAQLKQAARQQAELNAKAAEQARQTQREQVLFAHSVGRVAPLKVAVTPPIQPPLPQPVPRQRLQDEAQVLHDALSDEFDVESLLETDDELSYARTGVAADVLKRLRRGVWAIQAQLDLHGMRRDEARLALNAFLIEAEHQHWRCVRVIHGKGHGSPGKTPVLKGKVRSWLVQHQRVLAFVQAKASDGGHGAVVVLLDA